MVGVFMFSNEAEALTYINDNKPALLAELEEEQIQTIYTNGNIRINIMRNGKSLLKCINRFDSDKKLADLKLS
jgi:hypothetical protein